MQRAIRFNIVYQENLLKQIAEKNIPDAILDLIQNAIEQY